MAELPVAEFLRARLAEYDPTFKVRSGTAFDDLMLQPMQFITQPFRDEADELFTGQSLRRILKTDNPDTFNEELVDDLVANTFVYRITGNKSSGLARLYYDTPVNREYPALGLTIVGSNGKNYLNPAPFSISESQMSAQIENGLYYFDIPITSENLGKDTELLISGSLVTAVADTDVITLDNKQPIRGGVNRETNTQLISRARQSIGTRDLVTGKGFVATLFDNFPTNITELQAIGLGDDEMMRDILFNTHVGGKHDGYIKTPTLLTKTRDFITLLIDDTRASKTSTRLSLPGTNYVGLGEVNVDRTPGDPIVRETKPISRAVFNCPPNLPAEMDLIANQFVRVSVDDMVRSIRLAGADPAHTKRSEIVSRINNAFGFNIASSVGNSIQIASLAAGRQARIRIEADPANPSSSAVIPVFGNPSPQAFWEVFGNGPLVFNEGLHYSVLDADGLIRRIASAQAFAGSSTLTITSGSNVVVGADPLTFSGSAIKDYTLKITTGSAQGEYRITKWIDDKTVQVDNIFSTSTSVFAANWEVRQPGIKNGEVVEVGYFFNPLSIDVGKLIKLDPEGKQRGLRPGRENQTITDVAFMRIVGIETIDPISQEPLGQILAGQGGYGIGGYGEGPYGIGSGAEYRLVVNEPTARFSAFEDAYIVINSGFQGFSFRVTYEYAPEIEAIHTFCRSDTERCLDGDILVKHFLPAYVSGIIEYEADSTDISVPDNDALTTLVKDFINTRPSGTALQISDVSQFILKQIDPFYRYVGSVKPFTLTATIHNADGSTAIVSDSVSLVIPKQNPFPKFTPRPLSPRISHWIPDDIQLVRL